ncbi:MAG: recombinase family protein [Acidobacteriota bacterium]
MKQLFAYIRVSTPKQGKGVSLQEQRSAAEQRVARAQGTIIEWFTEKRTAAKAGRPEFDRMVRLLRKGKADGFVIHKIDRGSRNFRDWAVIDELIDSGVEVYFANDDLDLTSRGGRLAADIQEVVAIDYIRNLREEALKGIHGRLKQGFLPHAAPTGYDNHGAGVAKTIDPVRGPVIRKLFRLYASGAYTLRELTAEADALGLRNRNDRPLRLTQIHKMLRNVFYSGVIRSSRFGLFIGSHQPIVDRPTFDRVQAILAGKFIRRSKRHEFLFRRLLHCSTCGRSIIGGESKGHVYYRCSTIECPTTSIREDLVEDAVLHMLRGITLGPDETALVEVLLATHDRDSAEIRESQRRGLSERLSATSARLSRLTDLLLDGKIDTSAHDERRTELLLERQRIEQGLGASDEDGGENLALMRKIVELARTPVSVYKFADAEQKRRLLDSLLLNCVASGKTLTFSLREPFASLAKDGPEQPCRRYWNTGSTLGVEALISHVAALPPHVVDAIQSINLEEFVKPPLPDLPS